ncbi:hypothetical protein BH11PLA2_BH11PLA2_24710 [soil metagenome]
MRYTRCRRDAFTAMEVTTCLAVLAVAGLLIAQLATWGIAERTSQENRERALSIAENTLEAAKSIPANDLSKWAEKQALTKEVGERWPQGSLKVTVEPEKDRPTLQRITVTVRWQAESSKASPPIVLSAWVAEGRP